MKRNEEYFIEKSLEIKLDVQPVITRNCFQDPSIIQEIISNYKINDKEKNMIKTIKY